jgi:plasmid rolling circle replication initiator protein Rep
MGRNVGQSYAFRLLPAGQCTVKPNKRKTLEQNQAALHNAILETFKYSVKPSDMLAHDDQGAWLHEITKQTHRLFIS